MFLAVCTASLDGCAMLADRLAPEAPPQALVTSEPTDEGPKQTEQQRVQEDAISVTKSPINPLFYPSAASSTATCPQHSPRALSLSHKLRPRQAHTYDCHTCTSPTAGRAHSTHVEARRTASTGAAPTSGLSAWSPPIRTSSRLPHSRSSFQGARSAGAPVLSQCMHAYMHCSSFAHCALSYTLRRNCRWLFCRCQC